MPKAKRLVDEENMMISPKILLFSGLLYRIIADTVIRAPLTIMRLAAKLPSQGFPPWRQYAPIHMVGIVKKT